VSDVREFTVKALFYYSILTLTGILIGLPALLVEKTVLENTLILVSSLTIIYACFNHVFMQKLGYWELHIGTKTPKIGGISDE